MTNHPNRSKRQARIRIMLSNSAGPLDERAITAHRRDTDEQIAHATAQAAAALILEATFLYPGDMLTVTAIGETEAVGTRYVGDHSAVEAAGHMQCIDSHDAEA